MLAKCVVAAAAIALSLPAASLAEPIGRDPEIAGSKPVLWSLRSPSRSRALPHPAAPPAGWDPEIAGSKPVLRSLRGGRAGRVPVEAGPAPRWPWMGTKPAVAWSMQPRRP